MIELIDRFGALPESTRNLFLATEVKQISSNLHIEKIQGSLTNINIKFTQSSKINSTKLINYLQRNPEIYKMQGPEKIKISHDFHDPQALFRWLKTWCLDIQI